METKEGLETEEKVEQTTEPVKPEVKPPTTEEQMATLQTEMADLKTKYEQADKGLRSAQATLTQKDRLLKEKEDLREEIDTIKSMVKVLAVQRVQGSDEIADDLEATARQKRPDINKAFEELEQKQKAKEYQKQLQEQVNAVKSRVETLGLTENDETYWEFCKLATNSTPADFKLADIRLKKLEKEKESTPVDKKPTDDKDKIIADLQARLKKLERQEKGELDSETGLPTGAAANEAQIRKNFRENSTDPRARKEYMEWQKSKRGY